MFCTPQTTDIKIGQGKWQLPGVPEKSESMRINKISKTKDLLGNLKLNIHSQICKPVSYAIKPVSFVLPAVVL